MWKFDKLQNFLSKKKNISLLYIIVSICILLLAFGSCTPEEATEADAPVESASPPLAETLETVLGSIRGVDRVQVAVTYDTGTETVPARNRDKDSETVVTLGSGSNEKIVTEKEIMPRVRGVIVVCDGGDRAQVRADILAAVQALTGAAAHSIAVFPAK